MVVKVIYEETGFDGLLMPVWMIVEDCTFDWDRTLFIDIAAPFQRFISEEYDEYQPAITVPDYAYTRHAVDNRLVGIALPIVKKAAYSSNTLSSEFDLTQIQRLILRIEDIEDTLQYNIRQF